VWRERYGVGGDAGAGVLVGNGFGGVFDPVRFYLSRFCPAKAGAVLQSSSSYKDGLA